MIAATTLSITWFVFTVALSSGVEPPVSTVSSMLVARLTTPEVIGLIAGCGTTCAGLPDLIRMLRSRSSSGINPRMAAITGAFQLVWVYYGVLILSRPVIAWNILGAFINVLSVSAFVHFDRRGRLQQP